MLEWSLINPYGIQRDNAGQVWHAGHVNDVLQLDDATILVAADRGGVWRLSSQGDGTALSDGWENPDVLSLAFGPNGNQQVFASSGVYGGKGALWVTNPLAPDDWHKIPVPDATRGISRVVVLPGIGRIVIAAQLGLWWANIPPDLDSLAYRWVRAEFEGFPALADEVWAEVAEGPDQRNRPTGQPVWWSR
jgi:hypothetical protein